MVRKLVLPLLFCVAAAAVLGAAADDAKVRFALGVLRRDGILIPFAAYDDGDWSAPWPVNPRNIARPIALDDVPRKWWGPQGPDAAWRAWIDQREVPLALQKPVEYPVFCATGLGVATDYRGAPADPREPTMPKDGVAIAGNASLLPLERISLKATEATATLALITDEFNDRENEASKAFTRWKHPFDESERKRRPIALETLLRSEETRGTDRFTVSYIEAVRTFPPGPKDNGCGLITYVDGWVLQRPGRKPRFQLDARITYCDREGVRFIQPFGRLRVGGDVFWVTGYSSWRDEVYAVTRVRPDEVRPIVAVAGGACAR